MAWLSRIVSSSVGRKYIMALSGTLLGCFLAVHAAGNATIFMGRAAFLAYATHLHALKIAVAVVEVLLLALFLVHITTGIVLFVQNLETRTTRYTVRSSAGGSTWGSATMPYTGLIVLLFLFMHLGNFRFVAPGTNIADVVSRVLSHPLYAVLYAMGLGALALHISHGFWSLFQSAGISHPGYDRMIRVGAWIAGGLIVAVFVMIVLLLAVHGNQLA